jgi:hypothetical protein
MCRDMLKTVPQLPDVKIDYVWGGVVDVTRNRAPQILGTLPRLHVSQNRLHVIPFRWHRQPVRQRHRAPPAEAGCRYFMPARTVQPILENAADENRRYGRWRSGLLLRRHAGARGT